MGQHGSEPAALVDACDVDVVEALSAALAALGFQQPPPTARPPARSRPPFLMVVDARTHGLGAVRQSAAVGAKVIALVGSVDEGRAALAAGAADVLLWPAERVLLEARLSLVKRLLYAEREAASAGASSRRYQQLLESSADVLWRLRLPDLSYEYLSPSTTSMSGYSVAEGMARGIGQVLPPRSLALVEREIVSALAHYHDTGELRSRVVEIEQYHSDGRLMWVRVHATLVVDDEGNPVAIQGITHDISDRKRAEQALERSEARYRELVDSSPLAIVAHQRGRVLFANPAAARLAGRPEPGALLGRSLTELFGPIGQGEAGSVVVHRLVRRDGSVAHLEVTTGPCGSHDDATELVLRDVTERRQLDERMCLVDRLASVGTLAAGVAHEVSTPLSYLLANLDASLDLLRSDTHLSPSALTELHRSLQEAHVGAMRVRHVMGDLRSFLRGDDDLVGPVDLGRVLESAMSMAQAEIQPRARLRQELGELPAVMGHESRFGQVFLNLLVNAAQAIPPGRRDAELVTVHSGMDAAGRAVVEVSDTGAGIEASLRERIFDPFYTTKQGVGTGLGLTICRSIVLAAGGDITVESDPGRGTTVRVVLPAAPAGATPARRRSWAPPPARARVLVVDDDPLLCRALARLLPGHEVVTAGSGRDALALLADDDERFDLIICDVWMADLSGEDVFRQLAEQRPHRLERLVFMSGGALPTVLADFVARSGRPLLDKPIESAAVRALVARALSGWPPTE